MKKILLKLNIYMRARAIYYCEIAERWGK